MPEDAGSVKRQRRVSADILRSGGPNESFGLAIVISIAITASQWPIAHLGPVSWTVERTEVGRLIIFKGDNRTIISPAAMLYARGANWHARDTDANGV